MAMVRIKLDREVSNYFFDNGELTFELQVAVEGLVFTGGIPVAGESAAIPDNMYVWRIQGHAVVYKLDGNEIRVRTVMLL